MADSPQSGLPRAKAGMARVRALFRASSAPASPLELQLLGRILLHSALVGVAAGIASSLFFGALEIAQHLFLERGAGYVPLRAQGEEIISVFNLPSFRPWLIWIIPALGALGAGLLSFHFAPETMGGGSDAIIDSFHNKNGVVRRRVPIIKALASVLTLGSGGSGGREGPTMLIGGAIGSIV
ncbi:MAG: chloride channel protein, partial [Polyangiaceae bacterium]